MKITLDTNALHQEGYSSQNMQVLSRLSASGEVEVLVSELVLREYDSKRCLETDSKFRSVLDTFSDIKKLLLKSGVDEGVLKRFEEVEGKIEGARSEVLSSIAKSTSIWRENSRIKVLELSAEGMGKVWMHYFSGEGAFRKPKHREDIPDAAISQCILEAFNPEIGLTVICRDGQLKRYLGGANGLVLCDELSEFIAKDEVQNILRRLDSQDANIESIKRSLKADSFQEAVMRYISQGESDLYYVCWKNDEVEGYHRLPLPLAGGIRVDGPDVESVDNIVFGAVTCIAPKHFVIPLEFTADVPVSFAAMYFEWLQLPQHQRDEYDFDSMNGDGVCEVSVVMPARVLGQVVVCLLQDMTPEVVETQAGFMGHENCLLDIEYVGSKIVLM
ncbi:PIN domain-containing protein [Pseudomonas sp. NPDC086581]|uniref:PIN domain-containing protein n=1 Tax=Pseudomonas sp. NPDC086581 TaxID=3364432 RepID=UPI003827B8D8